MRLAKISLLLGLLLALTACTEPSIPSPTPAISPKKTAERSLDPHSFEGQAPDNITKAGGEAMERLVSYSVKGSLTRKGVEMKFRLEVVPGEGCKGTSSRPGAQYEFLVTERYGVHYRSGSSWEFYGRDFEDWVELCKIGQVGENLQRQSTEDGITPTRKVVVDGDRKAVRLSYGYLGFVDVAVEDPHRILQLRSPGVKLKFDDFNTMIALAPPKQATVSDKYVSPLP